VFQTATFSPLGVVIWSAVKLKRKDTKKVAIVNRAHTLQRRNKYEAAIEIGFIYKLDSQVEEWSIDSCSITHAKSPHVILEAA
jgi:hypothetical protein